MSDRISPVLDEFGKAFVHMNGKPRPELAEAMAKTRIEEGKARRNIRGSYDAASNSDELSNYWASADRYDADSANNRDIRSRITTRARHETNNNGFADGITQTYATDVVGIGPKLRMLSGSTGFNQMVEQEFGLWATAIQLRRKLWCSAHAKHQDGEGFGVCRTNPKINHRVKLDWTLYETEQCQTPMPTVNEPGHIDGIWFDEFGNPIVYDFLRYHPGAINQNLQYQLKPESVPARFVTHWFKLRRPGQHRGVPESASTLNMGATARRFREATVAAAETAADLNVMMTTQETPDSTTDPMAPFSTIPIQKRMLTVSPMGWNAQHFKSEHPNATYESFHKSLINEMARPSNMPANKALCNSADYNYSSGRLDHQTYYGALDVDREDGNDLVLDKLFDIWFEEAVREFGWLGGNPAAIGPAARAHSWDWPKHGVADLESEANANDTNLRNGSISPSELASNNGEDFDDRIIAMAQDYGVSDKDMRKILLHEMFPIGAAAVLLPAPAVPVAQLPDASASAVLSEMRAMRRELDRFIRTTS
jgi:hypothetical protein